MHEAPFNVSFDSDLRHRLNHTRWSDAVLRPTGVTVPPSRFYSRSCITGARDTISTPPRGDSMQCRSTASSWTGLASTTGT